MFEYMFILFGMNCANVNIRNFFTGLTLMIFFLYLIIAVYLPRTSIMIVMKVFATIVIISHLISYSVIKIKSEKIFQLFHELKAYRTEHFMNNNKDYYFSIISFAYLILSTVTTAMLTFEDQFDDLFKSLYLPVFFKLYSIVGQFYQHGWNILIKFIYYELYTQYYNIIESFNEELKKTFTKPSKNVILIFQRNVLNFTRFQSILESNIDFIKYFAIPNLISFNVCLLCSIVSNPDLDFYCYSLIVFYVIFSILYFVWIQVSFSKKDQIKNDLTKRLNKWQKFRRNSQIGIELLILKQAIQKFNGNQDEFEETVV